MPGPPSWVAHRRRSFRLISCDPVFQELHTDAPHGPWAFVLSLTPEPRAFAGGETLVMRPRVLNYWPGFDPSAGLEMGSLVPPACAPHACTHASPPLHQPRLH